MCHTDLLYRMFPELAMPMIFGHEGSGAVEAVGPGVTRVKPGDHVIMSYDSCGWCAQCLTDFPSYCDEFMARNVTGMRGDGTTNASAPAGGPIAARWFGQSPSPRTPSRPSATWSSSTPRCRWSHSARWDAACRPGRARC
jgi:aryl-alcohol dehydrogenase